MQADALASMVDAARGNGSTPFTPSVNVLSGSLGWYRDASSRSSVLGAPSTGLFVDGLVKISANSRADRRLLCSCARILSTQPLRGGIPLP